MQRGTASPAPSHNEPHSQRTSLLDFNQKQAAGLPARSRSLSAEVLLPIT